MSARILPSRAPRGWRDCLAAGAATLTLAASLALAAPIAAQDGTGGAPPLEETHCVLVPASDTEDLLAGTDTAPVLPTPVATPAAEADATPAAASEPVTFDAELLTEDLTATTTSLASCLSEGRFNDAATRTSPLFRGQLAGDARPLPADTFATLASTFPDTDYQIVEIANVGLIDEQTAAADVVWQIGHQVRVDRWTFVRERVQGIEVWVVDRAEPGTVTPSRDAAEIEVTIAENRYELKPATTSGNAVEFRITNDDAEAHELLVLQLDEGVSTSTLLTTPGPELPEGVTFIGQATLAPNATGGLLLADLEPGTYTIVDMLPDANGLPHLAAGMSTTFEVEGAGEATPAA